MLKQIMAVAGLLFLTTGFAVAQDAGQTIQVHAKRFAFVPAEITVKKGQPVKLEVVSDDVPHSLVVPGLHINSPMTKGNPAEISFTPDKAGDFKGQCGRFCGSGHGSMLFTVHVTE